MLSQRTNYHRKNISSTNTAINKKSVSSRSKSNHGPVSQQTRKKVLQNGGNQNIPYVAPLQIPRVLASTRRVHHRNISPIPPIRSKGKETARQSTNRQKSKERKELNIKLQRRMSFESPHKKDNADVENYKNFTLLNYMLLRQRKPSILAKVNVEDIQKSKKCQEQKMKRSHFESIQVLGKGGFGRVVKVKHIKTQRIYAMKEMSKSVVITKKSIQSVLSQRQLLSQLRHPYLVNMVHAFQDRQNLYLVMQYMPGGDLRYQIGKWERFPEHIVKFFVCCIVLVLQYLHQNAIIHRDIKPENIIVDRQGYLRLTDLGVAKVWEPENFNDTSGTPGYMAPEVINRENHSYEVDMFALGVIAYECMLGKRPYRGYGRQEIRQQILLYEASIKPHQLPPNWSPQSADCINKMLKRKASERLGSSTVNGLPANGKPPISNIQEVMKHPWFDDISWDKMQHKKYPSPFVPNLQERNYDTVSDSEYDDEMIHKLAENELLLRKKSVQQLFEGYGYQQERL